jgi:hypothetical protein
MKKRIICVLFLSLAVMISGCTKSEEADNNVQTKDNTVQQESNKEKGDEEKEVKQEEKDTDTLEEKKDMEVSKYEINIYHSNDDATGFTSETVEVDEITVDNIVKELVEKSVLTSDIKVNNFETVDLDGKQSINLDFNQAFDTFINGKGSTGEYYTVGSIVNTFLDAYSCEQIKITVEGGTLETGHTDYPGYMSRFE